MPFYCISALLSNQTALSYVFVHDVESVPFSPACGRFLLWCDVTKASTRNATLRTERAHAVVTPPQQRWERNGHLDRGCRHRGLTKEKDSKFIGKKNYPRKKTTSVDTFDNFSLMAFYAANICPDCYRRLIFTGVR